MAQETLHSLHFELKWMHARPIGCLNPFMMQARAWCTSCTPMHMRDIGCDLWTLLGKVQEVHVGAILWTLNLAWLTSSHTPLRALTMNVSGIASGMASSCHGLPRLMVSKLHFNNVHFFSSCGSQDIGVFRDQWTPGGGGGSQSLDESEWVDQSSAWTDWHQEDVWRGWLWMLRRVNLVRWSCFPEEQDHCCPICKSLLESMLCMVFMNMSYT